MKVSALKMDLPNSVPNSVPKRFLNINICFISNNNEMVGQNNF